MFLHRLTVFIARPYEFLLVQPFPYKAICIISLWQFTEINIG